VPGYWATRACRPRELYKAYSTVKATTLFSPRRFGTYAKARGASNCYKLLQNCYSAERQESAGRQKRIQIWLRTRDSNPEPCG